MILLSSKNYANRLPEATRMESFIRENTVGFASGDRSMIRNNRLDRNKARLVWITEDGDFISIVLFHPWDILLAQVSMIISGIKRSDQKASAACFSSVKSYEKDLRFQGSETLWGDREILTLSVKFVTFTPITIFHVIILGSSINRNNEYLSKRNSPVTWLMSILFYTY